jgi:hypothetical protein
MSADKSIVVRGVGAVSPAGWGINALRDTINRGEPIPPKDLARPGWNHALRVRQTPPPSARPSFVSHARLRRTSSVAHFTVSAALEALGGDFAGCTNGQRLGIVYCAMSGCVNYSRRFYDEVLKDPSTASPLVFPETVYNSPASHLAALLGTTAINYTIVGDPGTYLHGLALAADWLLAGHIDACLVIGSEEMDWLVADATRLFSRQTIVSDGAGALYLKLESAETGNGVRLDAVTDPHLFHAQAARAEAARRTREDIRPLQTPGELVCDSVSGSARADRDELAAWSDWKGQRLSIKTLLGEAFVASAAWQCVAAVDALQQKQYDAATVNVVGCNEQAIAARFARFDRT